MSVIKLDKNVIRFPAPELAQENGLLAEGEDFTVKRLMLAYTNGIFPWKEKEGPYQWWCPKERFIICPDEIRISGPINDYIKEHEINFRVDRDFADTVRRCRENPENNEGSCITGKMERAYYGMFKKELALSIEAFTDGEVSGGMYGACLGKCFFAEGMFSEKEYGAKLALIMLSRLLKINSFLMIDCKFPTETMESMGGKKISWDEYKVLLNKGLGNTR